MSTSRQPAAPPDAAATTSSDPEATADDERIDRRDEADDIPEELRVELPRYAGPMDLLVDLVREHEIDIFEIPVAEVTDSYLACIERMESLDLEVGGEWLEMAAWLVHLKSRTLVPDDDEDDEDEGPDPREELVRRLVEYEKFKKFAEKLNDRPTLGAEVFSGPGQLQSFRQETGPPDLKPADVGDLVSAVQRLVDRSEEAEEFVYEMDREKLSLRKVVVDLARRLRETPRLTFEELFDGPPSKNRVVTTFLALLEMTRVEMIRLMQQELGDEPGQIVIERAVIDIVEVSQTLDLPETDETEVE
jgi:segregation and condensation protein A